MAWDDIYATMEKALKKRGVVDDGILKADEEVMQRIGDALGCAREFVPVQIGGL